MTQNPPPDIYLQPARNPALALRMIAAAKIFLRQAGVDQWQGGYPGEADIRRDIAAGAGYFAMQNHICAAYLCLPCGPEPAYGHIDGAWLTQGSDYGLVHRLAIAPELRGQGIAKKALLLAEAKLRQMGKQSFRIDTDAANGAMRHILMELGFTCCGKIRIQNSEKLAFEKLLPRP